MPKVGMEPIRKAQLIEATFESIYRYGFSNTTISKVSKIAGVSAGIISHYFGGKDELLEATMRELLKYLDDCDAFGKLPDNSPRSRIMAIIDRNFSSKQVAPNAIATWLAFWAEAPHVPALSRLQKVNMRRLRSNLRYWLKHLLPEERAHFVAEGLAALIDGLWLKGAFQPEGINSDQAHNLCQDYLDIQLQLFQSRET